MRRVHCLQSKSSAAAVKVGVLQHAVNIDRVEEGRCGPVVYVGLLLVSHTTPQKRCPHLWVHAYVIVLVPCMHAMLMDRKVSENKVAAFLAIKGAHHQAAICVRADICSPQCHAPAR